MIGIASEAAILIIKSLGFTETLFDSPSFVCIQRAVTTSELADKMAEERGVSRERILDTISAYRNEEALGCQFLQ